MEKIYLKNYKGFNSQIIPITNVNFLVGENSTGKTSILKMINLLSSSEFWFKYEFNNNEVELGYFDEIINKRASEEFFQLGIEKFIGDEDEGKERIRILLEFHQSRSVPKLKKAKLLIGDFEAIVKFTPKQVSYNYKKKVDNSFEEWVHDFSFPKKYKILPTERVYVPLGYLVFLIENEINANRSKISPFGEERLYPNLKWIAPIRAKAKRTYDSYKVKFTPEGEHVPSILREIFTSRSTKEKERIKSIIEKFGKQSNLFDQLEIKELGKNESSPFEIIIKYQGIEVKLPNVGYGVSQSLPLITEIVSSKDTCFSIQQPEVHLHPRAQSAFGHFIFNSVLQDGNKFIIETHSDFTINRFRYHKGKSKMKNKFNSQILFFERYSEGNQITIIPIQADGSYPQDLPESYKRFFIDEELKMLEL